ncbi:MAG: DMT family transporter [Pseudomonadota bacterium]
MTQSTAAPQENQSLPPSQADQSQANNLKGALWLIGSSLFFTVFLTLAKFLSSTQDPVAIAFWRSAVGFLVTVPVILRQGRVVLALHRPWLVILRSLAGTLAFLCSMIAISDAFTLPLSQFNAISFARALFLTVLAAVFLREAVGPWRWGAVFVGFVGILIMVMPGLLLPGFAAESVVVDGGTAFALASAAGFATAIIMVKTLSADHSPITLLIWGNLFSTLFLGLWLIIGPPFVSVLDLPLDTGGWQTPALAEFGLLLAMAVTGVAAQYCYINAMAVGDASFLAPVDYLRLPMAALVDWLVFKLLPGLNVWIGAAIIVSATLVITLREQSKRAQIADAED